MAPVIVEPDTYQQKVWVQGHCDYTDTGRYWVAGPERISLKFITYSTYLRFIPHILFLLSYFMPRERFLWQ